MVDLHEQTFRDSGDVNMRKLKVQVRMNNIAYNFALQIIHFMRRYNNTMAMFSATIRITPSMIQRYHCKNFGNNSLTISFQ